MFWNIQNFGATRSGKPDNINEVRRIIINEDADIVCIQEIQTSDFNTAVKIVNAINTGITTAYKYILCPHNGFEMYLYLYKASSDLQAAVLGTDGPDYVDDEILPKQNYKLIKGSTISKDGNTGLDNYFPLFAYGDMRTGRAPGVGLFKYIDSKQKDHWLTIFNWHNDACNELYLQGNLRRLGKSKLIKDHKFKAKVDSQDQEFDSFIIGGDFNYSMVKMCAKEKELYRDFIVQIKKTTHLSVFNKEKDSEYTTSESLRDRSFDNILTCFPNGKFSIKNEAVVDIPQYYMDHKNDITKTILANSNLLTETLDVKFVRKRLMDKLSAQKKKKALSKTTNYEFKMIVDNENLYQTQSATMVEKISKMKAPEMQKKILVAVATEFITKETVTKDRWIARLNKMDELIYNDTLFFTRSWLSDHLPVVITLTP